MDSRRKKAPAAPAPAGSSSHGGTMISEKEAAGRAFDLFRRLRYGRAAADKKKREEQAKKDS